jgi:hypoxanthine phosphoribosyltransferase
MIKLETYYEAIQSLKSKIDIEFDAIVALKRSGWILGTYLSNQLTKPLFTTSEIASIPDKFKTILVVDDKICTGKSMAKVVNKLNRKNIRTYTATLFIERNKFTDYYVTNLNKIETMWYESSSRENPTQPT